MNIDNVGGYWSWLVEGENYIISMMLMEKWKEIDERYFKSKIDSFWGSIVFDGVIYL